MSKKYESYLRFTRPDLSIGLNRLLKSLEQKMGVENFINNPTGVIAANFPEIIGKVNIEKIGEANKLIFSILANDNFRSWVESYSNKLKHDFSINSAKKIDKDKIRMDMAEAILKSGDEKIVYALLNEQSRQDGFTTDDMQSRLDSYVTVETAIAAIVVAVIHVVLTAIDFTPRVAPTGPDVYLLDAKSGNDIRSIAQQLLQTAKANQKEQI